MSIRFGIIGAGQISQGACRTINGHDEATVVAATDPNADRLAAMADAHNIERRHESNEALMADPDIDAIYVAVPNAFHAPLAKAALEAGKHVILDKPFATSAAAAEEVAAAAAASGKTFMLGMNQRFTPAGQKTRSLVESGILGDIYHVKAYWLRRAGIPKLGTWFGVKEVAGGGALYDIGVHMLDLALFIIDNFSPTAVSGSVYTNFGNRGIGEGSWGMSDRDPNAVFDVDDFGTALIKLDGGVTVQLDAAWAIHQADKGPFDVQVYGTEGGAKAYAQELYRFSDDGGYQVIQDPKADIAYPHKDRFHHFINVLLGTEEPCISIEQALAVQRILDAIYESSATGHEVRF